MKILMNNFPKINFKANTGATSPIAEHSQTQPQGINPQPSQDTFEKNKSPQKNNQSTTNIFYVNDIHGRIGNMARIYSAKELFDNNNKDTQVLIAL